MSVTGDSAAHGGDQGHPAASASSRSCSMSAAPPATGASSSSTRAIACATASSSAACRPSWRVPEDGRLRLEFPDGSAVEGEFELGDPLTTQFFSPSRRRTARARPMVAGALRLLRPAVATARDRLRRRPRREGTCEPGLARLASAARPSRPGPTPLDGRRFRMLIEVDGVEPHAEDGWLGQRLQVGGAVLRFDGHVGRCLVTSRDPETGEMTLPTLDLLRGYRSGLDRPSRCRSGSTAVCCARAPCALGDSGGAGWR